ncbi:hydroxysqualene dehydroxylase HpnE [Silvimonas sp.]|uniref:hydroxysqualene dehydroxylase HpnE n=1 Tax=Silvimonas sp. TaxID=2650811 RepID=UPI00283D588F|nr:hydroxysqualene dehydroxylase HpnE [Silvimonas sp.]MDR3427712.1 hydroxysqualene dehydroxylase HpnE [Silvimonas sp.]
MTSPNIAVIGGGYAGMAAAVELAAQGMQVAVFEAGPVLGGRARKINIDGRDLDNGQHLLIGAYTTLLGLMDQVGVNRSAALLSTALDLRVLPDFHLRCPDWPAPLHLLGGLLGVQGLDWPARLALILAITRIRLAGWRLASDATVQDWLVSQKQPAALIEQFWKPLTVAALNTPIEAASAQVLLNTLRDSLGGGRAASRLLFPKVDFSALFPEPAAEFVQNRGGSVHVACAVNSLQQRNGQWWLNDQTTSFDGVVVALPPHRLSMIAGPGADHPLAEWANVIADWEFQPIVTLYYQYPAEIALPQPMVGCSGGLCQWVFDRNQTHGEAGLIAVVLSAKGMHSGWSQAELADKVAAELTDSFGWPAPQWQRVISEKRATFACTPDLVRPPNATSDASLWLAGDYTVSDYPATLEGAVRSGLQAARGIAAALKKGS